MSTDSELLREAEVMLYATLDENPTLAPEVARRSSRLENFRLEGNMLYFTLERHPHLFGRESRGMTSPGFFVVEQRYAFNVVQKTIALVAEHCTGIAANVDELVYEDVQHTLEIMDLKDFYTCTMEEEVRLLAENEARGITTTLPDSILLPDPAMVHNESLRQQWADFCREYLWGCGQQRTSMLFLNDGSNGRRKRKTTCTNLTYTPIVCIMAVYDVTLCL